MSAWLLGITLAIFTGIIYYSFEYYSLKKSLIITSCVGAFMAYTIIGFMKPESNETKITDRSACLSLKNYSIKSQLATSTKINWDVISSEQIELTEIQTQAWSEGNTLWTLQGSLRNNSDHVINALELKLAISDCAENNSDFTCASVLNTTTERQTDLNIGPHSKGTFKVTFTVQNPHHHYKATYQSKLAGTKEYTEILAKEIEKNKELQEDYDNKKRIEFIQKAKSAKALEPNIDYSCVGCGTTYDQIDEKKADPICGYSQPRWPLRGRILLGYKQNGNEGINIAVPEGAQVRASDGGIVIYAGNELENYGNLIIIKHPDGFTSSYAHNSELLITCGEHVKRGQTIARSGSSGNVESPQLHFELRKGSQTIDPMRCLAGPLATDHIIPGKIQNSL